MKCMTKYVALDVHQATTVASVRAEEGRVLARSTLPTEQPALVEFIRGMRGALQVAFEEGTQAQWLHDFLVPLVDRVAVCDRRGQARRGNKADRVDADELSELLGRGGSTNQFIVLLASGRTNIKYAPPSEARLIHKVGLGSGNVWNTVPCSIPASFVRREGVDFTACS